MFTNRLGSTAGRDRLFAAFLLFHAIATCCVDLEPMLPKAIRLRPCTALVDFYLKLSKDPLMIGAREADPNYLWFRFLIIHEGLFYLPCFWLGIRGLLRGTPTIYPLLLAYGPTGATTTAICMVDFLFGKHKTPLNSTQLAFVLIVYIPFVIMPAWIAIDMYHRIQVLISRSAHQSETCDSASIVRNVSSSCGKRD